MQLRRQVFRRSTSLLLFLRSLQACAGLAQLLSDCSSWSQTVRSSGLTAGGIEPVRGRAVQGIFAYMLAAAVSLKLLAGFFGVWAITFDWKHGPGQDLSASDLQAALLEVVSSGSLVGVGLAPQCSSLSAAVQPPLRSASHPEGKPGLPSNSQAKVLSGNAHGAVVARVVAAAVRFGVAFWVEGPSSSWLPCFEQILSSGSVGFWEFVPRDEGRVTTMCASLLIYPSKLLKAASLETKFRSLSSLGRIVHV